MEHVRRLSRAGAPPKIGIVHLGPGAFFRAFVAEYTDKAMQAQGGDWGILAVSLRTASARDQLMPQGGVYTSVTLSDDGARTEVIQSIAKVLVAPENPSAVIDAMSAPEVKIVSLTITEKGYYVTSSSGALDFDHPDVQHDLANIDRPVTAVGLIVAALQRRMMQGLPAFTILSCDNLASNGAVTHKVVLDFAKRIDPALSQWVATHARFPSTMVDRITPATTQDDIDALQHTQGYFDPACTMHEAFSQWAVEDDFANGRPAWEDVGVQMVASVNAHELMKLRCLNGTHSALAYLGYLAGHETISDCVHDPDFAALCERLWQKEILPVVPQPQGEDLHAYTAQLMRRYKERAIRHRTWQIAMDGSQKLPHRILGTIRDNLDQGRLPEGLCLVVAAWMRYVGGVDEQGGTIDVRDPLAGHLKQISDGADDKVTALLQVKEVFGLDLATNQNFSDAVSRAYARLSDVGVRAAVRDYLNR